MSEQAKNFVDICKGGSVMTIEALLRRQSQSVKDELMDHYKCDSYEELAVRLSCG